MLRRTRDIVTAVPELDAYDVAQSCGFDQVSVFLLDEDDICDTLYFKGNIESHIFCCIVTLTAIRLES